MCISYPVRVVFPLNLEVIPGNIAIRFKRISVSVLFKKMSINIYFPIINSQNARCLSGLSSFSFCTSFILEGRIFFKILYTDLISCYSFLTELCESSVIESICSYFVWLVAVAERPNLEWFFIAAVILKHSIVVCTVDCSAIALKVSLNKTRISSIDQMMSSKPFIMRIRNRSCSNKSQKRKP